MDIINGINELKKVGQLHENTIVNADCLEAMKYIPDKSVDMVLCDLPYGTTACKWDTLIPFEPLWQQYERVIKDNRAIVLFGSEPFTSLLICSNIANFKYNFYWRKTRPSGYTNAKLKPLKDIETISVFSNGTTANGSKNNMIYHPQGLERIDKKWKRPKVYIKDNGVNSARNIPGNIERVIEYKNYPRQVLDYSNTNHNMFHPTQKPIDLLEYLIKTYSNEGETILDNTMGSGSTGVACVNTNRKFIGVELDEKYFNIAKERINNAIEEKETKLF